MRLYFAPKSSTYRRRYACGFVARLNFIISFIGFGFDFCNWLIGLPFCLLATIFLSFVLLSCGIKKGETLTIFSAAGMTPVLEKLKEESNTSGELELYLEFSGSQVACRKASELGRACDMVISADPSFFRAILSSSVSFRLDFASDEIVFAFGRFAKFADETQNAPFETIMHKDVKLGRVDERLSPLGCMSLFACMLKEKAEPEKFAGLLERFKKKAVHITDDVMQLVPQLKTGQIDYAFVFKSTCVANEIRFVSLPPEFNFGDIKYNYSSVRLDNIPKQGLHVSGSPAIFSLTILDSSLKFQSAADFAKKLCLSDLIAEKGFRPLVKPLFYGERKIYDNYFANFADFAGEYF